METRRIKSRLNTPFIISSNSEKRNWRSRQSRSCVTPSWRQVFEHPMLQIGRIRVLHWGRCALLFPPTLRRFSPSPSIHTQRPHDIGDPVGSSIGPQCKYRKTILMTENL